MAFPKLLGAHPHPSTPMRNALFYVSTLSAVKRLTVPPPSGSLLDRFGRTDPVSC
jgi:hypothetical protein